ncbi:hypothetical protein BGW94_1860 [Fibrobacter sp. NR9]|nr:hypothetical protein BGW94_1860 [Fibrobacter sp. NR9]
MGKTVRKTEMRAFYAILSLSLIYIDLLCRHPQKKRPLKPPYPLATAQPLNTRKDYTQFKVGKEMKICTLKILNLYSGYECSL